MGKGWVTISAPASGAPYSSTTPASKAPDRGDIDAPGTTADLMRALVETNTIGLVRVTHAFPSLLQCSRALVVTNVGLAARCPVLARRQIARSGEDEHAVNN